MTRNCDTIEIPLFNCSGISSEHSSGVNQTNIQASMKVFKQVEQAQLLVEEENYIEANEDLNDLLENSRGYKGTWRDEWKSVLEPWHVMQNWTQIELAHALHRHIALLTYR